MDAVKCAAPGVRTVKEGRDAIAGMGVSALIGASRNASSTGWEAERRTISIMQKGAKPALNGHTCVSGVELSDE